ncbi:hypothetical protein EVAR_63161_1 [Eumeta japonica]|uniref:Uncharacterized protein n=1 Tax=Eumeta variegata TaxID=151549 RepID=A0A4C1Z3P6_EUMVA|nr:hypothetical protein EVAR_63161_1 [Eumeta japonica]
MEEAEVRERSRPVPGVGLSSTAAGWPEPLVRAPLKGVAMPALASAQLLSYIGAESTATTVGAHLRTRSHACPMSGYCGRPCYRYVYRLPGRKDNRKTRVQVNATEILMNTDDNLRSRYDSGESEGIQCDNTIFLTRSHVCEREHPKVKLYTFAWNFVYQRLTHNFDVRREGHLMAPKR